MTSKLRRVCARCGTGINGKSAYCRKDNGWAQRLLSLVNSAEADAELLGMADEYTAAEIGRMTGASRQAVAARLDNARRRMAERQAVNV